MRKVGNFPCFVWWQEKLNLYVLVEIWLYHVEDNNIHMYFKDKETFQINFQLSSFKLKPPNFLGIVLSNFYC